MTGASVITVCRGVLLTCIAAVIAADLGAQNDQPPVPAPGRLIDVGGWRLHLHCTGERRPGQPTVVLEAGVGAFSVDWSLAQPQVAEFARVCSYDRAGSGWSDWGPHPRTLRQVVYELHALLARSGEPGPFVLVGASYGGWVVRIYQTTYPEEVAGLVMVDAAASDPLRLMADGREVRSSELARERPVPPVKTSGPLRPEDIPPGALAQIRSGLAAASARANEPPRDKLPPEAQRMRTWGLGQVGHVVAAVNPFEAEELAELRRATSEESFPLGDLPLVALTRDRAEEDGPNAKALADEHRIDHGRVAALSRNSRHVIAEGSGHHIQIEDPALVAHSIRDVLARNAQPQAGTGPFPDSVVARLFAPAIFEALRHQISDAALGGPSRGMKIDLPEGTAWDLLRRHILTVVNGRAPQPSDSILMSVWLKDLLFYRDTLTARIGVAGRHRCTGGGFIGSSLENHVRTVLHGTAWEGVRVFEQLHGDALFCPRRR